MVSSALDGDESCVCAICALNIDFEIDAHLLREIERQNCVIFAGAGISTETRYTHPDTFYDQIKFDAKCDEDLPFPQLIDKFEARPNGRQELIQRIVERFDYIDSFRELKGTATRFHRELATMPYLGAIITTNWDRYFEEITGATPFVYESDVPFWETAKRPVLKIHGSIDNYTSIVASTLDYDRCEGRLRDGAIGAVLKQIFATKTCIFFGYSARDSDFLNIYNTVRAGMGSLARTHYLVSPFVTDEDRVRLCELNISCIRTDGTHFLSEIKSQMVSKFCFTKDESFSAVNELLEDVIDVHFEFVRSFRPSESPHLIFSTVYQDGLIHALQRILDLSHTGRYSNLHYVRSQINLYENMISRYVKERNYWEVSYFSGYLLGLEFLDMFNLVSEEELPNVPLFFHPGFGQMYENEYDEKVRNSPYVHKMALAQAKRILKRSKASGAEIVQHLPWA